MINLKNYPNVLDRFDTLWSMPKLSSSLAEELEALADLISEFEDRHFPLWNNPTYRELLNERKNKNKLFR